MKRPGRADYGVKQSAVGLHVVKNAEQAINRDGENKFQPARRNHDPARLRRAPRRRPYIRRDFDAAPQFSSAKHGRSSIHLRNLIANHLPLSFTAKLRISSLTKRLSAVMQANCKRS